MGGLWGLRPHGPVLKQDQPTSDLCSAIGKTQVDHLCWHAVIVLFRRSVDGAILEQDQECAAPVRGADAFVWK